MLAGTTVTIPRMLLTALVWLYAFAYLLCRVAWLRPRPAGYRRVARTLSAFIRSPAKPAWVKKEVIRLKALLPQAGCRRIAQTFNRRFAIARRMTVGKTLVSELIRQHRYEIDVLRRQIKRAKPRLVPKNLIWAVDLTGKATLDGKTRIVLGILEHASRAALWLEALPTKSSWALILKLADTIKRYGKPRILRTDNESVFASTVFASPSPCSASATTELIPAAPGKTAAWSVSSARSRPSSINWLSNRSRRSIRHRLSFASSTTTSGRIRI
jgi:hypothetical protein